MADISKLPKGSPPVKIDILSGKGVPGGFDAASIKLPSAEFLKLGAGMAAISLKASSLTSALSAVQLGKIPPVPGLFNATKKLDGLKTSYTNKLNSISKVPDFTKKLKLPAPPRLPSVPNFQSLGIPEIPKLPSIPTLPVASVPSVPNIPKLPSIGI